MKWVTLVGFIAGIAFFIREIVKAIYLEDPSSSPWTYISACTILTALVVAFIEWQSRQHHRNVCRDIEVRVKAVEERS